jgi:aminoglycoside phosphotransferase
VSHQPGSSTVVQYDAELRWPDRAPTGETIVAATGARIPAGADVLDDGTTQVGVWRWPVDPGLPGLASAMDPVAVAALLDDLGIDGGAVRLQVRAYRPGRRAVIEATGRRGRLFLKVVRPKVVEALHDTHRSLAAHLPVPSSLGWTDDGVVVLSAMPGQTLRELLRSSRSTVPAPASIEALLDRLPATLAEGATRAGHFADVERHARTIATVLPEAAGRLDDLRARLAEAAAAEAAAAHPVVPVHGDLYEAQLLVSGGRFSGLLDVDTAGAGVRADDWANLCAHLSVLTHVSEHTKAIKRYGAEVLAHAEAQHDRADLRARIAAAVVGLATGPFRVLERNWPASTVRRLDLAADWLDGR